jgi:competence protein ComEA
VSMTVATTVLAFMTGVSAFVIPCMAGGAESKLPEGPGKATMQKICSGCHSPEIVVGRHESKDSWERIVGDMADKGANGTDDEFNQIIDYLAANFSNKSAQTQDKGTK